MGSSAAWDRAEMERRMAFAEKLRAARLAAGLSQRQLAERSGVGRTTVAALEYARHGPTPEHVRRLARALRIAPGALAEICGSCGQLVKRSP